MDRLYLHTILLTEDLSKEQLFAECSSGKDFTVTFETVTDPAADLYIADRKNLLLWTDDFSRLHPYLDIQRLDLYFVYCGDSAPVTEQFPDKFPEHLSLWPAGEAPSVQLHRFRQLLTFLSESFLAWLYNNYLITAIDSLPDLVWYKSKDGLHWLVNKKFEETVHKTREQIHGMGHNYIWDVPPEDGGKSEFRCLESEREVMEKRCTCISDEHVKTSEGLRHFLTYKTPLYDRLGDIMGTVGIGHDVTDLNNFSLEIQMMLENLPFSVVMCDKDFHVTQVNSSFRTEFSFIAQDFTGFDYTDWKQQAFSPVSERTYSEEKHQYTQELSMTVGEKQYFFELMEQEILDYYGNVSGYFCVFNNITIAREYEAMILTHANTDFLTKLHNRRYFFEFVRKQSDIPLTVLFMDMDHFKRVNDTFGHSTGDAVLCMTADILRKNFPDALVARLGGDEFAAVISGTADAKAIQERSRKLQQEIEAAFAYMNLGISISVGIASADKKPEDIDAFLNESDQAMYQQKQDKEQVKNS